MRAMFERQVFPRLKAALPPMVIRTRFYRVAGMPESDLDQLIAPVYTRYTNPTTTILAAPADIQIHLRARCSTEEECESLLDRSRPANRAAARATDFLRASENLWKLASAQCWRAEGKP